MRTLAAVVVLAACHTDPEIVPRETTEIESVCQDASGLHVTFRECLSSSCDTLVSATCEATLTGASVLTVTGLSKVDRQGEECTDDCGFVVADCTIPAVDDPDAVIVQWNGDQGGPSLADLPACGPL